MHVRTWYWIGEGWNIVKADWVNFGLMSLVFLAVSSVVPVIIQGPLTAGFHYVFMKRMLNQGGDFGDLFKGFNYFVPAMVASIIISIFTFAGLLACLIPGLVVSAIYMFAYLFIVDRGLDFWPAMQASHSIVKRDYVAFTLFFLAFILVHILGALCCIVGLLLTIPIQYAAITVAYKDTVGFASTRLD